MTQENKISNRLVFKDILEEKGLEYTLKSGWYDDFYDETPDYGLDFNLLPLKDIKALQSIDKPIAVLVSSGSFNPPHIGHIDTVKEAEEFMRSEGYNVVSYFSPSHDMYVSKKKGKHALTAIERIELLSKFRVNIASWESLYLDGDVLYTDVVMQVYETLKKHNLRVDKILYVCGSDIAEYARVFQMDKYEATGALVIKRPGYEDKFYEMKEEMIDSKSMFFFESDNPIEMSSTTILENGYNKDIFKKKVKVRVRKDNVFDKQMVKLISKYFDVVEIFEIKPNAVVRDYFGDFLEHCDTISMDKFTHGDINVTFSREFDFFGMNFSKFNKSIDLTNIPNGFYILFDDDSATGYMMNQVEEYVKSFNPNIEVLVKATQIPHDNEYEIIDAYDFDFSFKDGGLLIDGVKGRLPYIYPFVNPSNRCSVDRPFKFSFDVINLNYKMGYFLNLDEYNKATNSTLTLRMLFDHIALNKKVEKRYYVR